MFRSLTTSRVRFLLTIVTGLGLMVSLYLMVDDPFGQWDFHMFYSAANLLAAGKSPYTPLHPHAGLIGNSIFQFPPLTIYLFQWTTLLSLASAKLVWLGLKLVALALFVRLWHKDFEPLDVLWPVALFSALAFNATVPRDLVTGNISIFEQLGIWFAFSLLLRERPYAAALVLACVAQCKLLPASLIALIPLVRPQDGWKPFLVGCAAFVGILSLNQIFSPELTHNYLSLFSGHYERMDERGINNPSSLALLRDIIDLTSIFPGLPYNRTAGTFAYIAYLAALILLLIRAMWSERAKILRAEPRLLIYFGCALYTIAMPRMKDYSYMLMLIPTWFVIRDIGKRGPAPGYFLFVVGLLVGCQPQQSYVPGMSVLIYLVQGYLPLLTAAIVMIYTLKLMLNARDVADSSRNEPAIGRQPVWLQDDPDPKAALVSSRASTEYP